MIKENQKLLNQLNVLTDGLIVFFSLPLAFCLRFYILPDGIITVPFSQYLLLAAILAPVHLITYAAFGLYESFRRTRLRNELLRLLWANILDLSLFFAFLFMNWEVHVSRWTILLFFTVNVSMAGGKRYILRYTLRHLRQMGYNQKHILLIGSSSMALRYLHALKEDKELGYHVTGYVAAIKSEVIEDIPYRGDYSQLEIILDHYHPDEVVSAITLEDYCHTPKIIAACEKTGTKLSIIPFYAEYMPSNPQFDELNGIPLMNIRRIPLDNLANAFCKRTIDIVGSSLLILLTSPIMLLAAIGVKLSSPGPIIFRQKRIGRNKKPFYMYKFRSMRINEQQNTGWSSDQDNRKTRFGALLRKFSIDEFPQFFNVLKGDMSLVGPRPEVPYYVEQFKEEIPLYMVKHQVRPGITGWAQVNGLRGDTSIKDRIEHDIYYIEHWNIFFDVHILFLTLCKGFINQEKLVK